MSAHYGRSYGFAYNRKEVKDHGEGGQPVGAPVQGQGVLVLDGVTTARTAVRMAVKWIWDANGKVVGVLQLLDRSRSE